MGRTKFVGFTLKTHMDSKTYMRTFSVILLIYKSFNVNIYYKHINIRKFSWNTTFPRSYVVKHVYCLVPLPSFRTRLFSFVVNKLLSSTTGNQNHSSVIGHWREEDVRCEGCGKWRVEMVKKDIYVTWVCIKRLTFTTSGLL